MSRSKKPLWGETHIDQKGNVRTKGIRNPMVVVMNGKKGGPMADKRQRRAHENKKSFQREEWE